MQGLHQGWELYIFSDNVRRRMPLRPQEPFFSRQSRQRRPFQNLAPQEGTGGRRSWRRRGGTMASRRDHWPDTARMVTTPTIVLSTGEAESCGGGLSWQDFLEFEAGEGAEHGFSPYPHHTRWPAAHFQSHPRRLSTQLQAVIHLALDPSHPERPRPRLSGRSHPNAQKLLARNRRAITRRRSIANYGSW